MISRDKDGNPVFWTDTPELVIQPALKNKVSQIRLLVDTYGNSAGDRVLVEGDDEKNIYYTDSFGRWCFLEKALEGVEFKYIMKA